MVGEVFAAVGGFKALLDTAKALKDMNDATVRNAAVIDLQEKILAAQEAHAAAIERIGTLEKEVAHFKEWDAEKEKYILAHPRPGTSAFVLKNEADLPEPSHLLCANCFERALKSYLQTERRFPGAADALACHECGSDIYVSGSPHPDHFKNRPNRRR